MVLPTTRVRPREDKALTSGGQALDVGRALCKKTKRVSFPDFSRRFFASLAEKIYTFSLSILLMFTVSLIPCCCC